MKKLLVLLSLFYCLSNILGQEDIVDIETSIEKISENEYNLIFDIYIEEDWHLYSQNNPEGASEPLKLSLSEGEQGFTLVDKALESKTYTEYSETWDKEEIFFKEEATLIQRVRIEDNSLRQISVRIKGQVCLDYCLPYEGDFDFALDGGEIETITAEVDDKSKSLTNSLQLGLTNTELLKKTNKKKESVITENTDLITIFLLGFFGGLLAFLTPCVFPLLPLTVSFFTKQSASKGKGIANAITYGLFIVLIYVLISLPFHFMDSLDPEILTTISTNVWLNLFFFVVLIFFAGSFFGFYEITLPSSWGNKMDSASGVGGIIGIFFMALTLAIVSFSCTGPILGSLLAGSLTGGATQLTVGMGGFGLALALPFALAAIFPSLLNSLPKSGGWMNTIKAILGFIEVALAFKFLSNADLVGRWGIFKREIFIAIWIIIFIITALFLFGILKFPSNKRKIKRLSGIRVFLGMLTIGVIVYLAPGLMEKPLWDQSLLSGLAPPENHSIYNKNNELKYFKDIDKGIEHAKITHKPILLDFTGWACVNCRKMEETVWKTPEIHKMLKDDFVIISLYVDDNENRLPLNEQFDYIKPNGKVKKIRTYGEKWSTMQFENFKIASQPYYVLLSPDLEVLNSSQQYTDAKTYYDWLEEGLFNFKH